MLAAAHKSRVFLSRASSYYSNGLVCVCVHVLVVQSMQTELGGRIADVRRRLLQI